MSDVALSAPAPLAAIPRARRNPRRLNLGLDAALGYALLAPALVYIGALVGYPFLLALWFSVSNATVAGGDTHFVGVTNYVNLLGDDAFRTALRNSLAFTFLAQVGKAVLGIGLAFLLLRNMPGKKIIRGFLMLPWTLPLSLSLLGWKWMFHPQFSVINYIGGSLGLLHHPYPDWLGETGNAIAAILIVNIWRGFPFAAVVILAGLTSIPQEIFDACKIDGAGPIMRWHYVITPMIAPILFIGLIFDVVFTLGDLTVVYLLTNGGPINTTDILPTLAYREGVDGGNLALGSATALFLFPLLFVGVFFFLRLLRRRDGY